MGMAARSGNVAQGSAGRVAATVARRSPFALALQLLGLSTLLAGCADGPAPRRPVERAPRLGLTTPTPSAPLLPGSAALAPGGPAGVFDPSRFVLVLDDPRLSAVREAAQRETYLKAAQELAAALDASPPPSAADAPSWRYQLGRLRALGGDPLGAVKAYDEAAAAPWLLQDYARFAAAELLVQAGQYDGAFARAQAIGPDFTPTSERGLLLAEALAGKSDIEGAAALWRTYLGQPRRAALWVPVALRFARALLAQPSEAHAEEAVGLARRVLFEAGGQSAGDAKEIETAALGTLPFTRRKRFENTTAAELLARARSLNAAAQDREALKVTDGLVALPEFDRPGEGACEAWMVRADALGKLKRKAEAADAYKDAIDRCSGLPQRLDALYAGGWASARAGRPPEAALRFALVEQEFPSHRYADDARLRGARAVLEMGDEARFARMLTQMPDDYPSGDKVADGLFELALSRIEKRDWAGAVAPLEHARSVAPRERAYAAAGRLPYYLGRARLETGSRDQGVEHLRTTIRDYPLSLYMALAYARLRDVDADAATQALAQATHGEPDGAFQIGASPAFLAPAFLRAVELARQGEGLRARAELDVLGVGSRKAPPEVLWAAAVLLARAGATRESHGIFRGGIAAPVPGQIELTDWLDHYPTGRWRWAWELAYPRPFLDLVSREAKRFGLSEAFAFAIMREESAFDPRVTSPANAVGLMQLIGPTAARMAKPLNLPSDVESLKRPAINVALGCRYLSILRSQFQDNPLLAIPGYNAGGNAPKKWVNERPSDDFDVFVERIPYEETRLYTKRVITSLLAYEFLYAPGQPSEALAVPLAVSPAAKTAAAIAASP